MAVDPMESQDSCSYNPLVLQGENGSKIPAEVDQDNDETDSNFPERVLHGHVDDDEKLPEEVDYDHGEDNSLGSVDEQKEGSDYPINSSPVLVEDNNASKIPERFVLYDDSDDDWKNDDDLKIVLFDSDDEWDEDDYTDDEFGYGPKIRPGYQRIPPPPPGFENAYLRHYNHDLCCFDDEYDSDYHLQKAIFESILESINFPKSVGDENVDDELILLEEVDNDQDEVLKKIILFDSDEWDEDHTDDYGYGPKIRPGYQRIPSPSPGTENAYLRHYNHDICCYDDEYDSEYHLQKAIFESILEAINFHPVSRVGESSALELEYPDLKTKGCL
ncbi:OLC1v1017261C2 [Oldenlandia corymbosa var. corymbosa]|uniref:OLC1v1017261C2 n=1 Tax=Oldenlandia corymbosa var. corymbosa TaxID=529605 RepID=A0AAV1E933_OLDCO|nr:OLC1v1017261C2 [Oldenlandia corymbosa var. corymbosa]